MPKLARIVLCAWVLWAQSTLPNKATVFPWIVVSEHESQVKCEQARGKHVTDLARAYACLPATINPTQLQKSN